MASRLFDSNPPADATLTLIRFADVPTLTWLPARRGGAALAVETVHRWATAGVRGRRLHFTCVGGVRCTTEAWLRAFFDDLAGHAAEPRVGAGGSTTAASQRWAAAAARRLADEGFGG